MLYLLPEQIILGVDGEDIGFYKNRVPAWGYKCCQLVNKKQREALQRYVLAGVRAVLAFMYCVTVFF